MAQCSRVGFFTNIPLKKRVLALGSSLGHLTAQTSLVWRGNVMQPYRSKANE
jgi:hypothetical protein